MALLGSTHLLASSLVECLSFVPRLPTLQRKQSGMVAMACICMTRAICSLRHVLLLPNKHCSQWDRTYPQTQQVCIDHAAK